MSFSGLCKIFFLFLVIQWAGLSLKADPTPLDYSCKTTADCPKDSWATCCSGKCMIVDNCCPGETPCGGSLCCPKGQKCDEGGEKCIPTFACDPGAIMCQGKLGGVGKCCRTDLCSSSGQCCLEEQETVCGEGCCTHSQCTTKGKCCSEGQACQDSCCTADKPICRHGKCTAYCDKKTHALLPMCVQKKHVVLKGVQHISVGESVVPMLLFA